MALLSSSSVAFPEIDPLTADAVDAMLVRLHRLNWGEAACQSRRLVRATLDGNAATRRELRRSEKLIASF